MKLKILVTKTRVPIYRSALWIVLTNNIVQAIDKIEDEIDIKVHVTENKHSVDAYTFAYVKDTGPKVFMLFLKPSSSPGIIAHEIKHVVNIIFLWHGVKLSANNDESECYFIERITDSVYNSIKRYKKIYKPLKTKQLNIIQKEILENT